MTVLFCLVDSMTFLTGAKASWGHSLHKKVKLSLILFTQRRPPTGEKKRKYVYTNTCIKLCPKMSFNSVSTCLLTTKVKAKWRPIRTLDYMRTRREKSPLGAANQGALEEQASRYIVFRTHYKTSLKYNMAIIHTLGPVLRDMESWL